MSRYLYLVRHGEQVDAEFGLPDGPLSDRGREQADRIADRLGSISFDAAYTSPLQRAIETAEVITERLEVQPATPSALLMDCIPSGPEPDMPPAFEAFFGGVTEEEIAAGQAQMTDALGEWFTPSREDRHELLITHNFVIAWFVREVFGASAWRWIGINQANCGLTIIRVRSAKPPVLLTHNDLGHLPAALRTGLPDNHPV
ncbi:MAG: histidine phosphatase family protein [Microbacteriaceae bacterium]|jgi:broad specificity phosphatase PhoE|nr:histidine phosphatase family protein [Microbacteriaceae bacterium]